MGRWKEGLGPERQDRLRQILAHGLPFTSSALHESLPPKASIGLSPFLSALREVGVLTGKRINVPFRGGTQSRILYEVHHEIRAAQDPMAAALARILEYGTHPRTAQLGVKCAPDGLLSLSAVLRQSAHLQRTNERLTADLQKARAELGVYRRKVASLAKLGFSL